MLSEIYSTLWQQLCAIAKEKAGTTSLSTTTIDLSCFSSQQCCQSSDAVLSSME